MREADEASTKELSNTVQGIVLAPPGVVMLAPSEAPRNGGVAKLRPRRERVKQVRVWRDQGQYKGWSPNASA